jgi:hypothetical protein
MKSNHQIEIVAAAIVVVVLTASVGWFEWPSLTGTVDEPDSLRTQLRAWIWPETFVPQTGQTLPSPNYLDHPPQYFPPTPPYPLPNEMKAILKAQQDAQKNSDDK